MGPMGGPMGPMGGGMMVDIKAGAVLEIKADMDTDPKVVIRVGDPRDNGEATDLKETGHRDHQTVDPMEVTETGTGTVQDHKGDRLVLEDHRVTCTVVEVLTLPVGVPDPLHRAPVELPALKLDKKLHSIAAEAAMVVTTAMATAVVTAWKVIRAIVVVIHRTAVRKGTARAQGMVIQKECLLPVV